jgi:DNA mismatch repair protein MutL
MGKIHRLPQALIGKIAAGEVVERPASVVKELLENAIDAGAGDISIELAAGGTARVFVRDDGCGMSREDAILAFERHATSKIDTFEDLLTIGTLGFRGEALAAISAVSRVELQTAEKDGEGFKLLAEPGQDLLCEPVSRPRGTAIEVSSLFFNVPARREFLKTPPTEARRVLEVVQGYALARPEIRFRVAHEVRELLDLLPAGQGGEGARLRIEQVFGQPLAEALLDVDLREGSTRIWGFVGDESTTRGRRYFVFVNGRLIRDRAVMSSFYRAVRDVWRGGEFPALFLFVDLPSDEVDVNVHPQKSEVRFRNPRLLHLVYKAIRRCLEGGLGEGQAPTQAVRFDSSSPAVTFGSLAWRGVGERYGEGSGGNPVLVSEGHSTAAGKLAETSYAPPERAPVPLTGRGGVEQPFRLLGQYKGTIILLEGPDGLYLVDQHVAHERILYERVRAELQRAEPQSQRLLEPQLLDLSAAETLRLVEWIPQLSECGFELTELSGDTIAVVAVPAVLKAKEAEMLLEELARGREGPKGDPEADPGALRDRILDALAASMACRSAIKMHEPLSADKMEAVVAELFVADQPYACPHGRPTILKMGDVDLERRFGRR